MEIKLSDILRFAEQNEISEAKIRIENQTYDEVELERNDAFRVDDMWMECIDGKDYIYLVI